MLLYSIAEMHIKLREEDAAEKALIEAFSIADEPRMTAMLLVQFARVQMQRKDFDGALVTFQRCLTAFEQIVDQHMLAVTHAEIAALFRHLHDYDSALIEYQKTESMLTKIGASHDVIVNRANWANTLENAGNREIETKPSGCSTPRSRPPKRKGSSRTSR